MSEKYKNNILLTCTKAWKYAECLICVLKVLFYGNKIYRPVLLAMSLRSVYILIVVLFWFSGLSAEQDPEKQVKTKPDKAQVMAAKSASISA